VPSFKKRALSLYLRNRCERQFVLYLYTDKERAAKGMPPRAQRAGLGIIGQAGYAWQFEKTRELKDIFGNTQVHEDPLATISNPGELPLQTVLPSVHPYQFIIEGSYEGDTATFRNALGLLQLTDYYGQTIDISKSRPDIIQVLPSMSQGESPATNQQPNPYTIFVLPNGTLAPLLQDDTRLRLRVIDVKLTAEPGAHYFAEVVYYSMTLAAWLEESGFSDRFVVVSAPAIWPGSHDASHLAHHRAEWHRQAHAPSQQELMNALEEDLELAVFSVFAPRLRSLLAEELPELITQPWDQLAWHVDYHCKGCEFLRASLNPDNLQVGEELSCFDTAERIGHLSRVSGLSRGGSSILRNSGIVTVDDLAILDSESQIFNQHQGLKYKRTAYPHRAIALGNQTIAIIPNSGGDAQMPKWPDLKIFLFMDYDLSSAISVSMAIRATWLEPLPFNSALARQTIQWSTRTGDDEVFLIDSRSIDRERAEFLRFLRQLAHIIDEVRQQDTRDDVGGRRDRSTRTSTYQIYLWDESQKKHLARLIGRHLPYILNEPNLRDLAWLFPPPELLQHAEEATRRSAITLIKPVVENTVAIDIPHYYGLLDLGQRVKPEGFPDLFIHPLYSETFSDLIPMERLHELWNHKGDWLTTQAQILQASRMKVVALNYVAGWLQTQLGNVLTRSLLTAPPIVQARNQVSGISNISHLWLGFTRLNKALESLDVHSVRAMPPHERVARFSSARLTTRLEGPQRIAALQVLHATESTGLVDENRLVVYELHPDSVDVNLQRGDFLFSLVPHGDHGFLDRKAHTLTNGTIFHEASHFKQTVETASLTSVSVEAIDRSNRLIALRVRNLALINLWESDGTFDFSENVMLDPVHRDFLSKKVELTLRGIGAPLSAPTDPRLTQALGLRARNSRRSEETPAAEILWNAMAVSQQAAAIDNTLVRSDFEDSLTRRGVFLNESQWRAWANALERQLSLIWGPPGTGKSHTLRAIALGALLNAEKQGRRLRVLVSTNNYTALDNVLLGLETELRNTLDEDDYCIYRIQSYLRPNPPLTWSQDYPSLQNLVLNPRNPSTDIQNLLENLQNPEQQIVVGCLPEQLHNLAILGASRPESPRLTIRPWFDFIIIDEASQIDVATSTLILSKRAPEGSCIIAGDDLQLPPIHQAEPPHNLETTVQSLYNYYRHFCGIQPFSLDVNYRSNNTIVGFTRMAGYSEDLSSFSPDLRLNFVAPLDDAQPVDWPEELHWTSEWAKFLDPAYPAVSFVYRDPLSTQINDFEADSVAALIWLMRGRLADQLLNEQNPDGTTQPVSNTPYSIEDFWRRAVGVVTPHRAQRSRVISRLRSLFPRDPLDAISGAVDTVERYQGQQRDVIIASYGIGDPDLIEAEDEFLYDLNRFNVLASRARAKVIVFCTTALLEHISNDIKVIEKSRLLKTFVSSYCLDPRRIQLGYYKDGNFISKSGEVRRR